MNLQGVIKKILKEETNSLISLRRRLDHIDGLVAYGMHRPFSLTRPCDYKNYSDYQDAISYWISERMYYDYFSYLDDNGEEWRLIYENIFDYIDKKHSENMKQYFEDECGKTYKKETNESELTEKCWPGYTQKGMKTMFGKRYPNCVKRTKK